MLRRFLLPLPLFFVTGVLAQGSVDPLRSASDKAQERFAGKPRGGDARSVTATDKVFSTVEHMPYVLEDTVPDAAIASCRAELPDTMDLSRPVMMRFIVERDGSLSAIEPLSDPLLDRIARCELQRMRWVPGTQGGVPVRVRTSLLLSFDP